MMIKSGAKTPELKTATTAVIRSFALGTPIFCALCLSAGTYMYSGPMAYVKAVSSMFNILSGPYPNSLIQFCPMLIIATISSMEGIFLSSVDIFLRLRFARFRKPRT